MLPAELAMIGSMAGIGSHDIRAAVCGRAVETETDRTSAKVGDRQDG
jgi:hypothetical protein